MPAPSALRAAEGIGPRGKNNVRFLRRDDAHWQDLTVYKMFGRIVYTPETRKFSSNRIALASPPKMENQRQSVLFTKYSIFFGSHML